MKFKFILALITVVSACQTSEKHETVLTKEDSLALKQQIHKYDSIGFSMLNNSVNSTIAYFDSAIQIAKNIDVKSNGFR